MSAETDLQISWTAAVRIFERQRVYAVANGADDYASMEATLQGLVPNDARQDVLPVVPVMRGAWFGFAGLSAAVFSSYLPAYQRIMGTPETDIPSILYRLYERMATNSLTVKSRQFSYGSPAAGGSNVGNGTLTRLTKDRYNFNIENGAEEAKSFTCVADEHIGGGDRWGELFEYRGSAIPRDVYPMRGQGGISSIRVLNINGSSAYVVNPGFEQYSASAGFTGWTLNSGTLANVIQETTRYYKDILPSTATPGCAKFVVSDKLYQTFSTQQIRWDPFTPMYAQISYMRQGSATGTLKLKIGNVTVTVDVSTKNNNEWNVLRWPAATPDQYAWFRNWNTSNARIEVEMDTLAVGTVLVDELIIAPYSQIDGTWFALNGGPTNSATVSGPATPFLRDDVFTFTDTAVGGAIIQEWVSRSWGIYFCHTTGSPTWVDPT